MNVDVVWLTLFPEGGRLHPAGHHISVRGNWDAGMIECILDRTLWQPSCGFTYVHRNSLDELPPEATGAVLVIPARHHAAQEDVDTIKSILNRLEWSVVILTGDEGSDFPVDQLKSERRVIWHMSGQPNKHGPVDRILGSGWKEDTLDILSNYEAEAMERQLDWSFCGQVTHKTRHNLVGAISRLENGRLVKTEGFTQGLPRDEYLRVLASSKFAPSPAGPLSPDSFRLYEALEAGCVPIVVKDPYWQQVFPDGHPFLEIQDWSDVAGTIRHERGLWLQRANQVFEWWQRQRREMAWALEDAVRKVSGLGVRPKGPSDLLTVIMPTSPVPSNPEIKYIEQTVASIRAHDALAEAEILLTFDGVHPQQKKMTASYEEAQRRLLWKCAHEWWNVLPIRYEDHLHQSGMLRQTLDLVRTPLVLYVEHDTPIRLPWEDGEIDWVALCRAVQSGEANLVRLHHEAFIHNEHKHLMLDAEPQMVAGAPMIRTAQWSQRPHVVKTSFYRKLLDRYFRRDLPIFIEDVMHSVVQTHWFENGEKGWGRFKLWIYHPGEVGTDIKRSWHTAAREGEPKYTERPDFFDYFTDVS